jgi:hypothetical protein
VLSGLIGKGGIAVDFLFHFVGIQAVVLKNLPHEGMVLSGVDFGQMLHIAGLTELVGGECAAVADRGGRVKMRLPISTLKVLVMVGHLKKLQRNICTNAKWKNPCRVYNCQPHYCQFDFSGWLFRRLPLNIFVLMCGRIFLLHIVNTFCSLLMQICQEI